MAYDVVVIGGGVIGLSIAWHVAERGMRVLVLERATAGAGSSGRGVGGIRQQFATPINIALSQLSLPIFAALGDRIGLRRHGYLYLALTEAARGDLWRRAELQRGHDVPVETLDPEEIRARFPYLRVDDVHGAAFCALDGYAMPVLVLAAYLDHARAAGAEIAEGVEVTGIRTRGGRVTGVETHAGTIAAIHVVDAAGPWARQVAALADVDVPVVPLKRQVWLSAPTAGAPATAPLTIDSDTGWHFRPREGGLLFAMPGGETPGDERLDLDPALPERMLAGARHRLPGFREELARGWAGLYEVTPDGHPILGTVDALAGFYLACGFSGHGLMHSPAAGLLLAALIGGEPPPVDISPLALARFGQGRLLGDGSLL